MIRTLAVSSAQHGIRLDDAVSVLAGISKGESRRIIDRGGCALNQGMVRVASRVVKEGDQLIIGIMQPGEFRDLVLGVESIVCQDRDLLAVHKPSGIASQRTPYQLKGTLEYWVAEEFARQGVKEPVRVVHRLDRGTSGLMLFPKHRQAAAWLSDLFKHGRIQKRYLALVTGEAAAGTWVSDEPIGKLGTSRWGVMPGGRPAMTEFRLLATSEGVSLIEAVPKTGRTHQIRVHLAAAGFPIIGDTTYGGRAAPRLLLHCAGLDFQGRHGEQYQLSAMPDIDYTDHCPAELQEWLHAIK